MDAMPVTMHIITRLLPFSGRPGRLRACLREESGTTLVEYGVAASLIGVVVVLSLGYLGEELDAVLCNIRNQIDSSVTC